MDSLLDIEITAGSQIVTERLRGKTNPCREPDDKEGFGHVLWSIIGGKNANISEAARRLKVAPPTLSRLIHDKLKFSQETITKKRWRKTFASYYSHTWHQNREAFEQHAKKLKGYTASRSRPPKNKNSFGYVLWCILGGKDANIGKAAQQLKIHPTALSRIIHGHLRISKKLIAEKGWRKIFADNYAEGWKLYCADFERHIEKRSTKRTSRHRPRHRLDEIEWRQAVGEFVKRVLDDNGDEIEDILPNVAVTALKKKEVWQRIKDGD
jgi:plasmid maintenance system antidote protein VapI